MKEVVKNLLSNKFQNAQLKNLLVLEYDKKLWKSFFSYHLQPCQKSNWKNYVFFLIKCN